MKNNNIRQLRNANKMSQTELGKILNVGKTTISNWETGYSSPDSDSLLSLAKIFGCSVDYILGKDDSAGIRYIFNNNVISDIGEKMLDYLKNENDIKYQAVIEKAKTANISPERLDKLIDFLKDDK